MSICRFACLSVYLSVCSIGHITLADPRGGTRNMAPSRPNFCPFPTVSVVDLRRGERDTPPGDPNSFNFMQFLRKFGKIVCWRPHLGEILDPPLSFQQNILQNNSLLLLLGSALTAHLENSGFATALASLSVYVLVLVTQLSHRVTGVHLIWDRVPGYFNDNEVMSLCFSNANIMTSLRNGVTRWHDKYPLHF